MLGDRGAVGEVGSGAQFAGDRRTDVDLRGDVGAQLAGVHDRLEVAQVRDMEESLRREAVRGDVRGTGDAGCRLAGSGRCAHRFGLFGCDSRVADVADARLEPVDAFVGHPSRLPRWAHSATITA